MTSTTRAAVLADTSGQLEVRELVIDDVLQPDEVLVEVAACGLCHSDLHIIDGAFPTPLPTVPGHEIAGVVQAVGSNVHHVEVGDPVVACLSMFCGTCPECLVGRSWLCERRDTLGRPQRPAPRLRHGEQPVGQVAGLGGLAEHTIVNGAALVRIPDSLPWDVAALLGCAVLTGTGSVLNGARVRPGETVAVIGCGGVGLNVVQAAVLAGALRVIAVDVHPQKLALATRFGATDLVDAQQQDPVEAVRRLEPRGVDHAFDVVGVSATAVQAVEMVRAGRTAWLVGVPTLGVTLDLPGVHLLTQGKGLQALLMGSNRFPVDIPRLADLYLAGRLELDALVSQRLPLDRVNEGFDLMRQGGAARAVVCLR